MLDVLVFQYVIYFIYDICSTDILYMYYIDIRTNMNKNKN